MGHKRPQVFIELSRILSRRTCQREPRSKSNKHSQTQVRQVQNNLTRGGTSASTIPCVLSRRFGNLFLQARRKFKVAGDECAEHIEFTIAHLRARWNASVSASLYYGAGELKSLKIRPITFGVQRVIIRVHWRGARQNFINPRHNQIERKEICEAVTSHDIEKTRATRFSIYDATAPCNSIAWIRRIPFTQIKEK